MAALSVICIRRIRNLTKFGAVLALVVFVLASSANANVFTCANIFRQGWADSVSFKDIEQSLATSKLLSAIPVKEYLRLKGVKVSDSNGTSPAYVVTLADGTKGVFKPLSDRTDVGTMNGEVAAYKVSQLLELNLVPPTVIRKLNIEEYGRGEIEGSFQYMVDTSVDLFSGKPEDSLSNVSDNEKNKASLLHFIIGQWDRHDGNFLVDNTGRLVVIDNGAMNTPVQWELNDFPWLGRGIAPDSPKTNDTFSFKPIKTLFNPSRKELRDHFGNYVSKKMIDNFFSLWVPRTKDRRFEYTFWNGRLYAKRFGKTRNIEIKELSPQLRSRIHDLKPTQLETSLNGLVSHEKLIEILTRLNVVRKTFPTS